MTDKVKPLSARQLATLADKIYTSKQLLKIEKAALTKVAIKSLKLANKIKEMESAMMGHLRTGKLTGIRGSVGNCALGEGESFPLENYEKFCAYVKEHDAFECFEKRVSKTAVLDRMAAQKNPKKLLPGLGHETWPTLSVTKVAVK